MRRAEYMEELDMSDAVEEGYVSRTHTFNLGDKVRFKLHNEWQDEFGIDQFEFERGFDYDTIYVITEIDRDDDVIDIEPNTVGFKFLGDMVYLVKTVHLPEDLFIL